MLNFRLFEFRQPIGDAFARGIGLVKRAKRLAFFVGGTCQLAVGRDEVALEGGKLFRRGSLRGFSLGNGGLQIG